MNRLVNFFFVLVSFQCCSCGDGVQIQVDLINHLMSHLVVGIENSDDTSLVIETIDQEEALVEVEDFKKQSKPSYRNLYNRRERSPLTKKIIEEFTRNCETKLFHCNYCMTGYKHKQTVERHLIKEHYPKQSCDDDNNSESIKEVFTVDFKSKTFYCGLCENVYKHKQTIERHLEKEHSVLVPKKVLKSKPLRSSLDEQYRRKRKRDNNLICDFCGQCFIFRESMRKHVLRHVNPPNPTTVSKIPREKIVCHKCTKLVDPSSMKRHIRVHHSNYRPFRCEEPGCTTTFFDITKFKDHQNIHLKIKPYVCEFCQESFHYASNLRQHNLRHTQPERFKCEICSHCFVSSKSLRLHVRLHSEVDPDSPKPFACDHEGCDKSFRYLDRLKLHIYNVHRVLESEHKCSL